VKNLHARLSEEFTESFGNLISGHFQSELGKHLSAQPAGYRFAVDQDTVTIEDN
jgi:hypothetical protein